MAKGIAVAALVLILNSGPALAREPVLPAEMVPRARPRIVLSADELPKRIEWAKPGGPLNPYVEGLKNTILKDRSWAAWQRTHCALVYLMTGDVRFGEKAWKPHSSEGWTIDRVNYDAIVYDWLVAGDEHWKQEAFPAAERKKFEERLAKKLGPVVVRGNGNSWTPTSYTQGLAAKLAAARALIGVAPHDAKARKTFDEHAKHMIDVYLADWNVSGGFLPCGVSYGEAMSDLHVFATAMMDGLGGRYDPWKFSRYSQERLLKKIAQDIPHTAVAEGLGGLAEPHGDINSYGWCDRWSVGILTKAHRDPLGQWYLRNCYTKYGHAGMRAFLPLLFVDPEIKPVRPKDAKLPLAYYTPFNKPYKKNAKAEGDGRVIIRSHWGDDDQTYIYFRCGDFFDGHQDVGNLHFSLYRKGYFAVQAASRHTYDSNNWREIIEYHHTSLPRNTITIMDTEMVDGPWGKLKGFLEGSQNHYCYRAYREGGHVEAFETNEHYTYVNADATPMYLKFHSKTLKRDRADEVRRQLVYVRSDPPGSDDVVVVFDRVDEDPANFAVKSPLKHGGASKRWLMNVATTPRRKGKALAPGIRSFETEGEADLYTLPAGGLWPGEESAEAQLHVQVLLPAKRTVRWVGGIDPEFDVPSKNLAPGLYYLRLVAHNGTELKKHPNWVGGSFNRWCYKSNTAGRLDTQIPFYDPNIKGYRCGFWIWPARESKLIPSGEHVLWQARVTGEAITILRNGKEFEKFSFAEYPTLAALENGMFRKLRTPGTDYHWRIVLIRGYEWWVDNWRVPTIGQPKLGDAKKQGFQFDDPQKVGWPIPGGALDGRMHAMGGIYAKAYPHLQEYPKIYYGKKRTTYSQRGLKQICGLWRMETMPRGEDIRENIHFLHVLSPVDKGVKPPQTVLAETGTTATVKIRTAAGRTITVTFNKLGAEPGGRIEVKAGRASVKKEFTQKTDLAGSQPGK